MGITLEKLGVKEMSEKIVVKFDANWSAYILELAEKRGIKPENLILDALVTYNLLSQELNSEEGGKALALLGKNQTILKEIIIPGHSPQFPDLASFTICPCFGYGVTVEE